jgi:hypothetical protein
MTERRRRIWQISLTAVFFALGVLIVLGNYDDLLMRIIGIASFASGAYLFWNAMKRS